MDADIVLRPEFIRTSTGTRTWQDPRLHPLPEGREGIQHPTLPSNEDPLYHHFKFKESKEVTEFDPPFPTETLEARGVKLEKFQPS
jgi:hypothetical protein